MNTDSLKIDIDKPYYLPGDTINGTIVIHLEKSVKVQRLIVKLEGREKVLIHEGRASYSSTNEMANLALQFFENQALTGEVSAPFQFKLPDNALPSFQGEWTEVSWKISAKLDISWHSHMDGTVYLRVWTPSFETSVPAASENPEQLPKASLEIPSSVYQPGENVKGKFVVKDMGRLRSVRVALVLTEDCTAQGILTNANKTGHRIMGESVWKKEQLTVGSPIEFMIPIPRDATTGYMGTWSNVNWNVKLTLDIPYDEDVNVYAPFQVALRKTHAEAVPAVDSQEKIPVLVSSVGGSQVVEAVKEPSALAVAGQDQTKPASILSSAPENTDMESLILNILGDGGSRDLIEIRSQLQTATSEFVDLNTVTKTCDQLVEQGKLKRTGTGEFFAQYSLAEA